MKKLLIILGFISGLTATVLSVTSFSKMAITPITIAFLAGLIIVYISRKDGLRPKSIQYIFLMVIISLSLVIYKGINDDGGNFEVDKTEQLNSQSIDTQRNF